LRSGGERLGLRQAPEGDEAADFLDTRAAYERRVRRSGRIPPRAKDQFWLIGAVAFETLDPGRRLFGRSGWRRAHGPIHRERKQIRAAAARSRARKEKSAAERRRSEAIFSRLRQRTAGNQRAFRVHGVIPKGAAVFRVETVIAIGVVAVMDGDHAAPLAIPAGRRHGTRCPQQGFRLARAEVQQAERAREAIFIRLTENHQAPIRREVRFARGLRRERFTQAGFEFKTFKSRRRFPPRGGENQRAAIGRPDGVRVARLPISQAARLSAGNLDHPEIAKGVVERGDIRDLAAIGRKPGRALLRGRRGEAARRSERRGRKRKQVDIRVAIRVRHISERALIRGDIGRDFIFRGGGPAARKIAGARPGRRRGALIPLLSVDVSAGGGRKNRRARTGKTALASQASGQKRQGAQGKCKGPSVYFVDHSPSSV